MNLNQIDIPAVGCLFAANERRKALWTRVKALRAKIRELGPCAGQLRLDLLKLESAWRESLRDIASAKEACERRAVELGL